MESSALPFGRFGAQPQDRPGSGGKHAPDRKARAAGRLLCRKRMDFMQVRGIEPTRQGITRPPLALVRPRRQTGGTTQTVDQG